MSTKKSKIKSGISIGEYKIIEFISSGINADCYTVEYKQNGQKYCMKIGKKEKLQKEIKFINLLNKKFSPYFIGGWSKTVHVDKKYGNYIIMELGQKDNWSVFNKKQKNNTFDIITISQLGIELSYMLQALHGRKLLHRDIKPTNIIFKEPQTWKFQSVLIDYDMMSQFDPNDRKFTGTTKYASPNIHRKGQYGIKDDMISSFFIIYVFHFGKLPWDSIIESYEHKNNYTEKREKVLQSKTKLINNYLLCPSNQSIPKWLKELYQTIHQSSKEYNYNEFRNILRNNTKVSLNQFSFTLAQG